MIGFLEGKLIEINKQIGLVATTGGVGYEVCLLPSQITNPLGTSIKVHIYASMKEDGWTLFGFEKREQKNIFLLLLTVDGIGPKTAFTIVSLHEIETITSAILQKDVEFFQKISGIGKKTALKVILELSTKMGADPQLSELMDRELDQQVLDTLVALGFAKHIAISALKDIDNSLTFEQKTKLALSKLSK